MYCLRFIIVVYYINGLLFEKIYCRNMKFYCILHKKYTVADCLVPEKAHMFSTKSDFCSIVYASYIWRIERQPQQLRATVYRVNVGSRYDDRRVVDCRYHVRGTFV